MDSGKPIRKRKAKINIFDEKYHGRYILEKAKEPVRLEDITPPATVQLESSGGHSLIKPDPERRIYAIRQPLEDYEEDIVNDTIPQCHLMISNSSGQRNCAIALKSLTSSITVEMAYVPSLITRLANLYNQSGYPYANLADALKNAVEFHQQLSRSALKKTVNVYCSPQPARVFDSGLQSSFQSSGLVPVKSSADNFLECKASYSHQKGGLMEPPRHIGQLYYQASGEISCSSVPRPPSLPVLPHRHFAP